MIILPAIDILDQQPVRLYQGDYEQKECVGDSIGDIAKAFEQQGARYVHMVDLNGAKEGKKINQDIIVKTAQSLQIPVELQYIDFAIQMEAMGVKTIIVTDISRDGTMTGPNTKMLAELKKTVSIDIIASGGIRDITHIEALKQLDIYGAITGKAMYAETLSLSQAIALCGEA